ncbi:Uncharacterised protein [Mycobacteroides abscessus subsp. abscessus]|nr:Uncharacterised protein [Mycobacteroides abscessus subsp. abscessus]
MLTCVGAVEDHVATLHLCAGNLAPGVVLVSGVVPQPDADRGEAVHHQPGAVIADSSCTGIDSTSRAVIGATAPGIRRAHGTTGAGDDALHVLAAIDLGEVLAALARSRRRRGGLRAEDADHTAHR